MPDLATIAVTVTSTYEASSVIASAAGRQANLAYAAGSGFSGTFSLAGVPTGPLALTIRTTDTRGNVDEFTVSSSSYMCLVEVRRAQRSATLTLARTAGSTSCRATGRSCW